MGISNGLLNAIALAAGARDPQGTKRPRECRLTYPPLTRGSEPSNS
jgi:hypothetical protein